MSVGFILVGTWISVQKSMAIVTPIMYNVCIFPVNNFTLMPEKKSGSTVQNPSLEHTVYIIFKKNRRYHIPHLVLCLSASLFCIHVGACLCAVWIHSPIQHSSLAQGEVLTTSGGSTPTLRHNTSATLTVFICGKRHRMQHYPPITHQCSIQNRLVDSSLMLKSLFIWETGLSRCRLYSGPSRDFSSAPVYCCWPLKLKWSSEG